jgi:hypothetical protein
MVKQEPGVTERLKSRGRKHATSMKTRKQFLPDTDTVLCVIRRGIIEIRRRDVTGIFTNNKAMQFLRKPVILNLERVPRMCEGFTTGKHS